MQLPNPAKDKSSVRYQFTHFAVAQYFTIDIDLSIYVLHLATNIALINYQIISLYVKLWNQETQLQGV